MVRTRSSSLSSIVSLSSSENRRSTRRGGGRRGESTSPLRQSRKRGFPPPLSSSDSESESLPPPPPTPSSSSSSSTASTASTPSSSSPLSSSSPPFLSSPPPPPPSSPPWCCTCLEVGAERCNLRRAWSAYARPGEEHFSHWLQSKHMSPLTPDDLFPVYLLMKLKRTEAATVLAEMFFGWPPSPRWAAADESGHLEPLLAFCRHQGVPWEKPSLTSDLPPTISTFSLDPAEAYRQLVVEHFKLLVGDYLLRHYFYYYNARPRLGVLELVRLLNSMYGDLMALNGLQSAESQKFQFYFTAGWLEEFTRRHPCYRRLVVFPPRYQPRASLVVETEQTSCTVLVHAKKLAPVDPSVSSDDIWQHCYISQLFYDPFDDGDEGSSEDGNSSGLCDCGQLDCPGCSPVDCLKCGGRKCGAFICRTVSTFFEGDLLTRHVPQFYHWRRQQQ